MIHPQYHYVLGWLIVVVVHNWPVLIGLALTVAGAVALWRKPSRRRVAFTYGSTLLVVAYEYHKHVGPQLQDAANYLLMFELLAWNRPVYLVVGPLASALVLALALLFIGYACVASDHHHYDTVSPRQQIEN